MMAYNMVEPQRSQNLGSIQKTTKVVEGLKQLDGAGVSELAEHLDIPKTTVHAHLTTLHDCELISKRENEYRVGLKFAGLGEFAKHQYDLYSIATEEVDILAEESNDMAQFMIEEHGRGVYLYKAEPPRSVQTTAGVGDRRPLHCTGLGKSILSCLPEERVEEIIDRRGMPAKTENTITDFDQLLEQLATIREQGYAVDDQEIQPGLRCVAAPVNPDNMSVVGAVSVSSPTSRLKNDRLETEIAELVTSAANVIEINIRNVQ
jgi:DNA-binding IclR family transcriptional regulator